MTSQQDHRLPDNTSEWDVFHMLQAAMASFLSQIPAEIKVNVFGFCKQEFRSAIKLPVSL